MAKAVAEGPASVLVEAEAFGRIGGWVVDPQFMDVMGSPYLLAHGQGRPVADAVTTVELAARRRKLLGHPETPESGREFDFVVVGGGMAGTCATITATRLGLKVALVQDRPVLGGNNSSEVRVWLQGARSKEPWPRIVPMV